MRSMNVMKPSFLFSRGLKLTVCASGDSTDGLTESGKASRRRTASSKAPRTTPGKSSPGPGKPAPRPSTPSQPLPSPIRPQASAPSPADPYDSSARSRSFGSGTASFSGRPDPAAPPPSVTFAWTLKDSSAPPTPAGSRPGGAERFRAPSPSPSPSQSQSEFYRPATGDPEALSKLLRSLSFEQRDAALAPIGDNVRLLAGPGSGKTRVIVARIVHMIESGVDPSSIAAITFTNKGANEMKERLEKALGEDRAGKLTVSTFHSFFLRQVIRPWTRLDPYYVSTGRSRTILDPSDILTLAKRHWERKLSDKPKPEEAAKSENAEGSENEKPDKPERLSSEVREKAAEAAEAQVAIVGIVRNKGDDTWDLTAKDAYAILTNSPGSQGEKGQLGGLAAVSRPAITIEDFSAQWVAHRAVLDEAGGLGFDDMQALGVHLVNNHPPVLSYLQRRYRHVLVDEFQDTNAPQFKLVERVCGGEGAASLFVVGDANQSIYGWRGARVENISARLSKDVRSVRTMLLQDNYRSTPEIVAACEAVLEERGLGAGVGASGGRLKPMRQASGRRPQLYCFDRPFQEAEWIALEVQKEAAARQARLAQAAGAAAAAPGAKAVGPYASLAVLVRTRMQLFILEKAFVSAGIPYVIIGTVPFYQRAEVKDLLAYMRLVCSLDSSLAFDRVVNCPARGLGGASLASISAAAVTAGFRGPAPYLFDGCREAVEGVVSDLATQKPKAGTEYAFVSAALSARLPPLPSKAHLGVRGNDAYKNLDAFRLNICTLRALLMLGLPGGGQGLEDLVDAIFRRFDYDSHLRQLSGMDAKGAASKRGVVASGKGRGFEEAAEEYRKRMDNVEDLMKAAGLAFTEFLADSSGPQATQPGQPGSDTSDASGTSDLFGPSARLACLDNFLQEVALMTSAHEGEDEDAARRGAALDRVSLMTIHASKGLEFPTVFVGGVANEVVPGRGELDEERNVLFVAMSRAQDRLVMTYCLAPYYPRGFDDKSTANKLSRFLEPACQKRLIEVVTLAGPSPTVQGTGAGSPQWRQSASSNRNGWYGRR